MTNGGSGAHGTLSARRERAPRKPIGSGSLTWSSRLAALGRNGGSGVWLDEYEGPRHGPSFRRRAGYGDDGSRGGRRSSPETLFRFRSRMSGPKQHSLPYLPRT